MKWHVLESTPGYMPESEPVCFNNRRDANSYARDLAAELREQGYKLFGTATSGEIYAERDADDLGRIIEIVPCEGDCEDSL